MISEHLLTGVLKQRCILVTTGEGRKLYFYAETEVETYEWLLMLTSKHAELGYIKKIKAEESGSAIPQLKVIHYLNNPFLKELSIRDTTLSLDAITAISATIKVHATLQSLVLDNNGLTDTSIEPLCEALKLNTSIRILSLRNNFLNEDSGKHIAEVSSILLLSKEFSH